jgi:glycosyltransferase involved in cell wall biosynthesis
MSRQLPTISHQPRVALVLPCRNEESTIGPVLDSLLAQDYPSALMEVIVVDGCSEDRTAEVARQRNVRLLANPTRGTAEGFNIGIRATDADIIFTLGAHTRYASNYVSALVRCLAETGAWVAGSVAVTEPGAGTVMGRAIAKALSQRFGVGNSAMRVGVAGPVEADTASCPAYRREVFERVGLFNPHMVRNQDIEFNLRLRRAGGRIVIDPRARSYYRARATLSELGRNSFANGLWVVRGARVAHLPFCVRHLVPLLLLLALLAPAVAGLLWRPALLGSAAVLASYLGGLVWFAGRSGELRMFGALLVAFPVLHFSYGLGSLCGLWPRAAHGAQSSRPSRQRSAASPRQAEA